MTETHPMRGNVWSSSSNSLARVTIAAHWLCQVDKALEVVIARQVATCRAKVAQVYAFAMAVCAVRGLLADGSVKRVVHFFQVAL